MSAKDDIQPSRYDYIKEVKFYDLSINLSEYPQKNEYEGTVKIYFQTRQATKQIAIHTHGLTLKNAYHKSYDDKESVATHISTEENQMRTLTFDEWIKPVGTLLVITFFGKIGGSHKDGIYKTHFALDNNDAIFSHFKIDQARKCFPCFDEPHLMAEFKLSIEHPEGYTALSNMNAVLEDGKMTNFDLTAPLSTYCYGFCLIKMDVNEMNINDIKVRIHVPVGHLKQATYATSMVINALDYFDQELTPYPSDKLDVVAIHNYEFGEQGEVAKPWFRPALSQFGLIYVPVDLMLGKKDSYGVQADKEGLKYFNEQKNAAYLAHAVARQWFGNVVSLDTWNDQWLQHGLSWFYAYYCIDQKFPDLNVWEFFLETVIEAFRYDHPGNDAKALLYTENTMFWHQLIFDHPMHLAKSAAIIRMIYFEYGYDNFKESIKQLLTRSRFTPIWTTNLHTVFRTWPNSYFTSYIDHWLKTTGYPLISVKAVDKNGRRVFTLTQDFDDSVHETGNKFKPFWIPMRLSTEADPKKEFTRDHMDNVTKELTFDAVQPGQWINFNYQHIGYYRVHYSDELLKRFLPSFKNKTMTEVDRFTILASVAAEERDRGTFIEMITLFVENVGWEDSVLIIDKFALIIADLKRAFLAKDPEGFKELLTQCQTSFTEYKTNFLEPTTMNDKKKNAIRSRVNDILTTSMELRELEPPEEDGSNVYASLVLKYDLKLYFKYPQSDTYTGKVTIRFKNKQSTKNLAIHSSGLNITEAIHQRDDGDSAEEFKSIKIGPQTENEMVHLYFDKAIPEEMWTLTVHFEGKIGSKAEDGIYKSKLDDGSKTVIANFRYTRTRKCFPCFDEPNLKAQFLLQVTFANKDTKVTVLSNMSLNQKASKIDKEGKVIHQFHETEPMSPYMLSFMIADRIESIQTKVGDITISCYTSAGKTEKTRETLIMASKALKYFQDELKIPYPSDKIDIVQSTAKGEDAFWGLIYLPVDRLNADHADFNIVSEEQWATNIAASIAHAWFGLMVSSSTWEEFWLNRSLANMYAILCVEEIAPELLVWDMVLGVDRFALMMKDTPSGAMMPIQRTMKLTSSQINNVERDLKTGLKPVFILIMILDEIGHKRFKTACTAFLNRFKFKSASTIQILKTFDESSGRPVTSYAAHWIAFSCFPVIKVQYLEDKGRRNYILHQSIFDSGHVRQHNLKPYIIPIRMTTQKNPGKFHSMTLMETETYDLRDPRFEAGKWVHFNKDCSGYYIVNYPRKLLEEFMPEFKSKAMPADDRFSLIFDICLLREQRPTFLKDAEMIMENLGKEYNAGVWYALNELVQAVWNVTEDYIEAAYDFFKKTKEVLNAFKNSYIDHADLKEKEKNDIRWNIDNILETIGYAQNPDKKRKKREIELEEESHDNFETLKNVYLNTNDSYEKYLSLEAMAKSTDRNVLQKGLCFVLASIKNPNSLPFFLMTASESEAGKKLCQEFLNENKDRYEWADEILEMTDDQRRSDIY
ncbi:hypothetical protein L596_022688 [Steinernema carpocapsae]|uniref:Aminopeptidase n=1 Tax=Steinernema carpocapsae TaxID=34508 RepID=A0A4U5MMD7_STECR|nr:hypothetical protein L596_022688 [Steinernema carpocapsae]